MGRFVVRLGITAVLALECAGQYPPGQYPPGQYPPGQYPPGQSRGRYPDSGTTFPRIPGRKPKGDEKITVIAVDGTLRKLSEKELVLEAKTAVLRFRLTAKAIFVDKGGEAVRDSLLKPGDSLTVQARPEDPETAVRIVLVKSGGGQERANAGSEIDPSIARAPTANDMGRPRTITVKGGKADDDSEKDEKADARRSKAPAQEEDRERPRYGRSEPARDRNEKADDAKAAEPKLVKAEPAPVPKGLRDPAKEPDEEVLAEARSAVRAFAANLPKAQAKVKTTKYFKAGGGEWQRLEEAAAVVSFADGKADYASLELDGNPTNRSVEQLGFAAVADFERALEAVVGAKAGVVLRRVKAASVDSRPALLYEFQVAQADSQWWLVSADGRRYNPPFSGTLAVDQETHRVLRVEQKSGEIPSEFPFASMEWAFDFTLIRLDKKTYLTPSQATTISCLHGSGTCTRRVSEFREYGRPE